jgi:hypothetical protein
MRKERLICNMQKKIAERLRRVKYPLHPRPPYGYGELKSIIHYSTFIKGKSRIKET